MGKIRRFFERLNKNDTVLTKCDVLLLTTHNWQKWKSKNPHYVTTMKFCREEAVGLKKLILYLKNYDFCKYVKFGAFSLKIDVL